MKGERNEKNRKPDAPDRPREQREESDLDIHEGREHIFELKADGEKLVVPQRAPKDEL